MRRGLIIGIGGVVVLAAAAFWFLFLRDDAPPELTLEDAVAGITSTTAGGEATPSTTAAPVATTAPPDTVASSTDGLDGTWAVDQANTQVGYRIGEEISGIGTTEAVGRTSQVTGSLALAGTTIESVAIEVDMTSLRSDSDSRDNQLRDRGLQTNSFPTASFVLTEPIDLGGVPQEGDEISATAVGELTLHGVTRTVEIPLDGTLVDGTIVVVGSLQIALADFDIEPPTGFRILSIEDEGVFEVQLAFVR